MPPKNKGRGKRFVGEEMKIDFGAGSSSQKPLNAEETKVQPAMEYRKVSEVKNVQPPAEPSPFDDFVGYPKKKVQQAQYRPVDEPKMPKLSKEELEQQQQAMLYFEQ